LLSYAHVRLLPICSIAQVWAVDNILGFHVSLSVQNYYIFTLDLLFPTFLIRQTLAHILLLFHLRILRKLKHIPIFLMFVAALFRNTDLSRRFQLDDIIINWTDSYNLKLLFPNYTLLQCCLYSRHGIFARYVKRL
jgi:hypothetical protein